jgi:hypothetical protein
VSDASPVDPAVLAAGAEMTRTVRAIRDAITARMAALPADNAGILIDAQIHSEAAQRAACDLEAELGTLFAILAQVGS